MGDLDDVVDGQRIWLDENRFEDINGVASDCSLARADSDVYQYNKIIYRKNKCQPYMKYQGYK